MKAGFTIRTITVKNGDFTYRTHRLTGWLNGRRIREQFKSRPEADGRQCELEVLAANVGGTTRARVTRLGEAQLAEAENAITRLAGRSLSEAVNWYLETYRPPQTAKLVKDATAAFLLDRAQHVCGKVMRGYRHTMASVNTAFADRCVHQISTADVQTFLVARKVGKKRFNNLRGELHTFFAFCRISPQQWTQENPVTAIPAFKKIARGLPKIISAKTAGDLMQYVESYSGGPLSALEAGCMVPYFALCLFAGLRPSVKDGEIQKLSQSTDLSKVIDLELSVIHVSPEVSKVKSLRSVTIQPNLAEWLVRYPLKRFPILPPNAKRMIRHVRDKFLPKVPDTLRHTFISMHVAKFKSMGEAALEAGNSEAIIRKHYYNTVTAADAEAFWNIRPGVAVGEVVQIAG